MSNNDNNLNPNPNRPDPQALEDAVGALFSVGRMWASHGLRVAELALETSARTLRVTAEALGEASEQIEDKPE